jgi:hypothetical protein
MHTQIILHVTNFPPICVKFSFTFSGTDLPKHAKKNNQIIYYYYTLYIYIIYYYTLYIYIYILLLFTFYVNGGMGYSTGSIVKGFSCCCCC